MYHPTKLQRFAALAGLIVLGAHTAFPLTLGSFNFNTSQFGDSLSESDGGTFRNGNWLNIVNSNPGNPGALTGANFDTGIANIGIGSNPVYTIGYNTLISNQSGADLGIVSARFSFNDTFELAVSQDGVSFSSSVLFGPSLAMATGVQMRYYYNGGGPFSANLYVTPVDLNAFGLSAGATIQAVRITGSPEADLIRVAGINPQSTSVPDGASTFALLGSAVALFAGFRRRFL